MGFFFIIWRNYTDRMSPYGIPFTHNAFPSWRRSVRGHIACLQGELFRAEKKLQWLSVHVGWGWGPPAGAVSTRWREICHMHSLNWGLCRLLSRLLENPAHQVASAKTNSAEANFKKVLPQSVTCWELSSSPVQSNKNSYDDLHRINSLSLLYWTPCNGSDLSLPQKAELLPLTQSFLPLQSGKRRGCASAAAPLGPRPHKGRKRQPQRFALWPGL